MGAQDNSNVHVSLAPLSDWTERVFDNNTQYSIQITQEDSGTQKEKNIQEDSNTQETIRAVSQSSASMLYKKMDVDLNKTPYLQWQWKITNTYSGINEQSKAGDDYPARIYIAVKGKFGSLFPRAINYVWASTSPQNSYWPNPYSDNVIMLAKQSGDALANQWVSEKINLKADLQEYFKKDFSNIKGIAIMSDTDNAKGSAESFYRNIRFSAQ